MRATFKLSGWSVLYFIDVFIILGVRGDRLLGICSHRLCSRMTADINSDFCPNLFLVGFSFSDGTDRLAAAARYKSIVAHLIVLCTKLSSLHKTTA